MNLQKRTNSFRYAFKGLTDLFVNQPNTRIHLGVGVGVGAAGFFFDISKMEWVALAICITLVLVLEATNTALEYLTDLISPDFHPLAGKTKDAAAAAVLLAAIGAVVVGLIIFFPKIFALFS